LIRDDLVCVAIGEQASQAQLRWGQARRVGPSAHRHREGCQGDAGRV